MLEVRLQPRASADRLMGVHGDGAGARLKLALTAPPVEGAANTACQAYLARLLGVAPSAVSLVAGAKAKDKRWAVKGNTKDLLAILAASVHGSSHE